MQPVSASRVSNLWQPVVSDEASKPLTAKERLALKFCRDLMLPPVATTPKERAALPALPDWPTLRWTLSPAAVRHLLQGAKIQHRPQCAPKTQEASLSSGYGLTIGHPNLRQLRWNTSFIFEPDRLKRVTLRAQKGATKADESALLGELTRRHGPAKVTHKYASNAHQDTTYHWQNKGTVIRFKARINLRNQERLMEITYSKIVKQERPRSP